MNIKNEDLKILLIDDDTQILEDIEFFLGEYGYKNFKTARGLEDLREKFFKDYKDSDEDIEINKNDIKHFDIIIVDMRMDEKDDGFKFIEEYKKLSSFIIIYTANDSVMDCRKALISYKVWDYIPKKIGGKSGQSFEELHKSIQRAIEYKKEWGNRNDDNWIAINLDELVEKYGGKYIAVMDREVIEVADSESELDEKLKSDNRPYLLPVKVEIPKVDD